MWKVLAERRELAIHAVRLDPPRYITSVLGERPTDPVKREAWDRGVSGIESYRQRHGVGDPELPFGPRPRGSSERAAQQSALHRLRESQRRLGLARQMTRTREQGMSMGFGR